MKTFFGILPLVIGIPSYAYYVRTVLNGKTIPNMYSWLIWAVLAGIGFVAQVSAHAGPGAWNTGFTAVICFLVFLLAFKYGERKLSQTDILLLVLAGIAVILRFIIGSYTFTILLTTLAALIGFVFTLKKAYKKPKEENQITFTLNSLRNLISLFALSSINFVTFFYPFCMMLANLSVSLVISTRSRRIH